MLGSWFHRLRLRRLYRTVEPEPVETLPPPVDGAPADQLCVGPDNPPSGNCSRLADWHTERGYLCDDHYLAWLERLGKYGLYGDAEVQADGRWRVFKSWPDAGGWYELTHSTDQVRAAISRRSDAGDPSHESRVTNRP